MESTCGLYLIGGLLPLLDVVVDVAQESLFCDSSEGHMKYFLSCP